MMFGIKNTADSIGRVSVVECLFLLIMLIGYFFFLIFKPDFFGEFTKSFKTKLMAKFYNAIIVERIVVGSGLVLLISVKKEGLLPLIIFLLIGAFIGVKQPYKEGHHNWRQVANMAIAIVISAIFLAYSSYDTQMQNHSKTAAILPILVLILLLICVIYNGAAIVYSIYKMLKKEKGDDGKIDRMEEMYLDEMKRANNLM